MTSETKREVEIIAGDVRLPGTLATLVDPSGAVVFAHGSGSSRFSPRNRQVAGRLHDAGLATLLFDLLTPEEAEVRANVFDIELLAGRLSAAAAWVRRGSGLDPSVPLGYFGASTGPRDGDRPSSGTARNARSNVTKQRIHPSRSRCTLPANA